MNPANTEERDFVIQLELELTKLGDVRALDDWYAARVRSLPAQADGANGSNNWRAALLDDLYRRALTDCIGRAAEELTDSNTGAHREVLDKYDAAWRELANR